MTPDPTAEELEAMYEQSALEYYQSLPVEDTIDTVPQGRARQIVLSSFSVIRATRPDVQCFNELLIEYPGTDGAPGRVVPNNFVVVHPEPIKAGNSFDMSRQPARPLLALEYVTEYRRKEFEQNAGKYERDLRIPYYLRVYPHDHTFSLFRLVGGTYSQVLPDRGGRVAIPELEMEVGLHDGWVRFWFRGEMVPLPGELLLQRNAARAERDEAIRSREIEAENAKLREELAKAKGTQP